jgi:exonuclease III
MVKFSVLSAALELRIFENDKTTPRPMIAAKLSAEADFVGKWTVNDDLSYTQSLSGTEMVAEGFNSPIVTLNMPDAPKGFAADFFTLVLPDAEGQTMTRTLPAMTFEKGKRTVLNLVFVPDNGQGGNEGGEGGGNEGGEDPDQPDQPVTPDPEEPETITGTFTCATYNVDGLPAKVLGFIDLNDDGPGSAGTKAISQKIATSGWDIVTFQENFTYNSELKSAMSAYYTFGTHREFSLLQAVGTADTDGLGFATLKSTCSFSDESWWAFTEKYGGLTSGADENLKKGIRHYIVTMKDGVQFDLLVTHMNSGSKSEHISARASQLKEIAAYINEISAKNRPIIFMGDTNCRYTRDDMFQYLFNNLDSNLTYADPWVEYSWDGVYPTLGSASLMVPSKDSSSTLTEQTGEVVDKVIYINNQNADTQIKANYYLNDTSFAGMADHNPVVAEFTYVRTIKK